MILAPGRRPSKMPANCWPPPSRPRTPRCNPLFLVALQSYYAVQAGRASVEALKEAERVAKESFEAADTRCQVGVATPPTGCRPQTAWSQAALNRFEPRAI